MSVHQPITNWYPDVIPAKAGIHLRRGNSNVDSRFRGNDEHENNKAPANQ